MTCTIHHLHGWRCRDQVRDVLVLLGRSPGVKFAGHDQGAENWATFATLIETCKLGGINPQAYLTDVLSRIVLRSDADPIDDLLPYNWTDSRKPQSAVIDQAA